MKTKTLEYALCKTFYDMVRWRKNEFKTDFDLIHVANERIVRVKEDIFYIQKQKNIGMCKGALDYMAQSGRRTVWIEFKTEEQYKKKNHSLSEAQLLFLGRLHELEIPSLVTYDPVEAFEFLQQYF